MNIPLITPIIRVVEELGGRYMELQRVKATGKITVAAAAAEAEATVLIKRAESVADWETTQAVNAGSSWKDEFWTLLVALPIPFVFVPETRPWVMEGFAALQGVPEWYMWVIAASVSASFGIRTGLFDKLGGSLTSKKGA